MLLFLTVVFGAQLDNSISINKYKVLVRFILGYEETMWSMLDNSPNRAAPVQRHRSKSKKKSAKLLY